MQGSLGVQADGSPANLSISKGHFGAAYVHTIAAGAGFGVEVSGPVRDAAGIDLTVVARPPGARRRARELHLQVKCTAHGLEDDAVAVDLPIKNYDELRDPNVQVPMVLVVVLVPESPVDWLSQTESELIARRCAWWMNLAGMPPRDVRHSVRIRVPRSQIFTPDALASMMDKVVSGGLL